MKTATPSPKKQAQTPTTAKPKKPMRQPIPCLAAIASPIAGVALGYQWQAIGYFPSRKKARDVVDKHMADNPTHTFVILPQKMAGQSHLYDQLAATLPQQPPTA